MMFTYFGSNYQNQYIDWGDLRIKRHLSFLVHLWLKHVKNHEKPSLLAQPVSPLISVHRPTIVRPGSLGTQHPWPNLLSEPFFGACCPSLVVLPNALATLALSIGIDGLPEAPKLLPTVFHIWGFASFDQGKSRQPGCSTLRSSPWPLTFLARDFMDRRLFWLSSFEVPSIEHLNSAHGTVKSRWSLLSKKATVEFPC